MKTLKNMLITLAAILTFGTVTNAQVSGYVKVPYNIEKESVLVEPNVFYKLPEGVSGYTFIQLTNEKQYYGKTFLKKTAVSTDDFDVKSKTTIKHANELFTAAGTGISIDAKFIPGVKASASYLPVWVDKKGNFKEATIDAYIAADLPFDFKAEAFGEWGAGQGKWVYGEARLGKEVIKGVYLTYNPILKAQNSPIPGIEHRASILVDL